MYCELYGISSYIVASVETATHMGSLIPKCETSQESGVTCAWEMFPDLSTVVCDGDQKKNSTVRMTSDEIGLLLALIESCATPQLIKIL